MMMLVGTDPTNIAAGWCMRKTWQISAVALGYRFCNVRHLWRKTSRFAAQKNVSFRTPHISGLKYHEDSPGLARCRARKILPIIQLSGFPWELQVWGLQAAELWSGASMSTSPATLRLSSRRVKYKSYCSCVNMQGRVHIFIWPVQRQS